MPERLIPCAECSRHVKSSDAACPFCRAPLRAARTPVAEPYARLRAAAAVAAGVAAVVSCTTYVQAPSSDDGGSETEDASFPTEDASTGVPPPSNGVFYGSSGIIVPTSPPSPFPGIDASAPPEPRDARTDAPGDSSATDSATIDGATDAEVIDAAADDGADGE